MNKMMIAALCSSSLVMPRAFDTGGKWKLDADGKLAVDTNGNPIYLKDDGGEQSVDGGTISRLNGEAKSHRERAEKAELALKPFEGLDPAAAKTAVEVVKKLGDKQLIDAGEVQKVRDEIAATYTAQIGEKDKAIADLDSRTNTLTKQLAFGRSEFIADRIAVPREMFEATFGDRFKVEEGKIVPYDASGNKIFSKKRMGEIADIDEAFEIMVESYPHKDAILKAPATGGSGNGGGGGNRGSNRVMRRADFDALNPIQKAEAAGQMGKGELVIAD